MDPQRTEAFGWADRACRPRWWVFRRAQTPNACCSWSPVAGSSSVVGAGELTATEVDGALSSIVRLQPGTCRSGSLQCQPFWLALQLGQSVNPSRSITRQYSQAWRRSMSDRGGSTAVTQNAHNLRYVKSSQAGQIHESRVQEQAHKVRRSDLRIDSPAVTARTAQAVANG